MAKLLENISVSMGRLIKVANLSPRFGQNDVMYAANVEDQDGTNERWLLFTKHEVDSMSEVTGIVLHKPGRLYYHHKIGGRGRCFVSLLRLDRANSVYKWNAVLPDALQRRALKRAQENPEDIPEKNKLKDLLD